MALVNLHDSMKTVVRMMWKNCPNSNTAMKLALSECMEIMDSSTGTFIAKIMSDEFSVVGVEVASYLVGEYWKGVKTALNELCPVIEAVLLGYKTGKYISNTVFKTDAANEQYHKMLAVLNYEELLDNVFEGLDEAYANSKTVEEAEVYLSAIDLMFSFYDSDFVNAYGFVDKIDGALINKIYGYDYGELKRQIGSIQKNCNEAHESILTDWVFYLDEDYYEGMSAEYQSYIEASKKRKLNKKYVITCPVDVYVYDSDHNLVGYVEDNRPYCESGLTVAVQGEQKEILFYDDGEYQIECIGTDTGMMDITVNEYGEGEKETRTVNFYDIPLEDQKSYEMTVNGSTQKDSYSLAKENGDEILPDADSGTQKEDTAYKLKISSGTILYNDEPLFEAELHENETVEIRAFVADGYEFAGWISDVSDVVFGNAAEQITTVRMPGKDISVTALLRKADGEVINPAEVHKKFTVSFNLQGHGTVLESYADVKSGSKIEAPKEPDEKGYKFTGWYKEASCQNLWDFEKDIVVSDMTLYAGWEEEKEPEPGTDETAYTVTFNLQGKGTALEEYAGYVDIVPGSTIKEPVVPGAEGYQFTGWYKDAECTAKWDFTKDVVNADMTLYAGWEEIPARGEGDVLPGDKPADGKIPDGIWMAGIGEYTYISALTTPEVRVYNHDRRLVKGRDYTVSYKNNKKAAKSDDKKAPTVIVKGIGNYTGTVSRTFTIRQAELTIDCLVASSDYCAGNSYAPVVMLDGNVLKARTDYTIAYYHEGKKLKKQPVTEGSYSMRITGKGSCTGDFLFPYKVIKDGKISISKGKAIVPSMVYGGKEPTVSLTVDGRTLTSGTDYTVRFTGAGAKGTATAVFTGAGKYTGVLKKAFRVKAVPLPKESVVVASTAPDEKGGAKAEVIVTVNGAKLTEGVDYIVSYKGNAKPGGLATATVKGRGNYSGSQKGLFKVTEKDLATEGVQIYVSDAAIDKKPAVMIYDTNGKKLSAGSDYTAKIDTASHKVTITGGKNRLYTVSTPIMRDYHELAAGKVITFVSLNRNADSFPGKFQYATKGIEMDKGWLTVKAGKNVLSANDFEVVGYVNNTSKGTAAVIIQGIGGYGGIKALNFKIQPRNILFLE